MSHHGHLSARILSVHWPANRWERDDRAGRSSGSAAPAGPDDRAQRSINLETRTLLSVSAVTSPWLSSSTTPAATEETLNVQLQPGSAGSLSQLTSLITAAGRDDPGDDDRRPLRSARPHREHGPARPRALRQPGRPVCRPRTDRLGPDGAQRPRLHQRRRVAVERHLGHQCSRGLERHHRLRRSDCRRHRHGYRLQPSRPL